MVFLPADGALTMSRHVHLFWMTSRRPPVTVILRSTQWPMEILKLGTETLRLKMVTFILLLMLLPVPLGSLVVRPAAQRPSPSPLSMVPLKGGVLPVPWWRMERRTA